jgi:hypothetical protein
MFSRKLASCSGPGPKRPLARQVSWLAAAVLAAGCGSAGPTDPSTPLSCTSSDGCVDYTGTGWTLSNALCSAPSTLSTSACPTADVTGSCTFEAGAAHESVLRSYSPLTTTSAQSVCTTKGGVFEGPACTPDCTNKACGDNGCGGSCGTCAGGTCSSSGTCSCQAPSSTTNTCDDDTNADCGRVCCSPDHPYYCAELFKCYMTEADAQAACGGACHACLLGRPVLSCNYGSFCIDYTGRQWTEANALCGSPATLSKSPCPTTSLEGGSCIFSAGAPGEYVFRFYPPSNTSASAQEFCEEHDGTSE